MTKPLEVPLSLDQLPQLRLIDEIELLREAEQHHANLEGESTWQ